MSSRLPVAIVGGGFSGTILAAWLARLGLRSALFEGSGRIGRGVAYSTGEPAHLLNVRAERMSAWADDPDHFVRYLGKVDVAPGDFAERRQFGRYLDQILKEARTSGLVDIFQAKVVGARRDGVHWMVELAHGSEHRASALVLASGNQAPDALPAFAGAGERHIANPWGADAQAAIDELAARDGAVLLVGTGLTMVDVVLSLDAEGHRGPIIAVSRRGQVPRSHATVDPAPVALEEVPRGSLRALVAWLRTRAAEVGWRSAIDSLRTHSHPLWQSLSPADHRRFLRHARPFWDVHRHRIAPPVAATLTRLISEGRLEILAGRIASAEQLADGLRVAIRPRGTSDVRELVVDYAINCTGPLHSIERTQDPLLRGLLDCGAVAPDALGIGLDTDPDDRVGERLWALGPLTKGRYWEMIAVPDIREQAAAVARDIAEELKHDRS